MRTNAVAQLFNTDAHNPSFASVCQSMTTNPLYEIRRPVDYCVPVNRHFPPQSLMNEIREALPEIVKYYPDYAEAHQQSLSEFTGIPAENLLVANGSTELITLLCQQANGPFAADIPTFGRWTDLPLQHNQKTHFIERLQAQNFELSVSSIVKHVRKFGIRTLVLCNPNNPVGAVLSENQIKLLVENLNDIDRIIIDESFIDFSDVESASDLALKTPRLIVVKSLGKSLGWHGLRLGYAVAETNTAENLRSMLPYWNVNGLAAFVLKRLPSLRGEFNLSLASVRKDREYMLTKLSEIHTLKVFPSQANFLFVALPARVSGQKLRNVLLSDFGLMVRECSNKIGSSEQYLRLAVNLPHETDRLHGALCALLEQPNNFS